MSSHPPHTPRQSIRNHFDVAGVIERDVRAALQLRESAEPYSDSDDAIAPRPFFRLMGGKWRVRHALEALLPPGPVTAYVEPFFGGGAFFWHLRGTGRLAPEALAVIADVDEDLVHLLGAVQHDPNLLLADIEREMRAEGWLDDPAGAFYRVRHAWNGGQKTPALQLLLRSSGFNGVWRKNKRGQLNTPWDHRERPRLPSPQHLQACQQALSNTHISPHDFRGRTIAPGAVVYVDPPYAGVCETKYTPGGWTKQDTLDVIRWCAQQSRAGAFVLFSNHDVALVRDAFQEHWPEAVVHSIGVSRPVNSAADKRGKVAEVIATSPLT